MQVYLAIITRTATTTDARTWLQLMAKSRSSSAAVVIGPIRRTSTNCQLLGKAGKPEMQAAKLKRAKFLSKFPQFFTCATLD